MSTHFLLVRRLHAAVGILRTFCPPCFYRESSMRTRQELSTLAEMLSLLPVPNHNFTSFSTVEKRTCKLVISTIFLVRVPLSSIQAAPKIFCRVNGALDYTFLVMFPGCRTSNLTAGVTGHRYTFERLFGQ